jgi:hypothetical protein
LNQSQAAQAILSAVTAGQVQASSLRVIDPPLLRQPPRAAGRLAIRPDGLPAGLLWGLYGGGFAVFNRRID